MVHFRFAGEDGRLAAEMREQVAQGEGFEFVVHFFVARAGAELLLEPVGERGFEQLAGRRSGGLEEFAGHAGIKGYRNRSMIEENR